MWKNNAFNTQQRSNRKLQERNYQGGKAGLHFFLQFYIFYFPQEKTTGGGEPLQNSNLATADEVDTLLLRSSLDVEVDEEADDRLPVDDELDGKDSFNRFMDGAFRLMGRLRLVRKSVTTRERGRNQSHVQQGH